MVPMLDHSETPTQDDVQALIDKLVDFDATLTPAQRSVFRSRILTTMPDGDDVEGHTWEMRWEAGATGIFRQWVWVDDGHGSKPADQRSK
jgi:hypothetical protein